MVQHHDRRAGGTNRSVIVTTSPTTESRRGTANTAPAGSTMASRRSITTTAPAGPTVASSHSTATTAPAGPTAVSSHDAMAAAPTGSTAVSRRSTATVAPARPTEVQWRSTPTESYRSALAGVRHAQARAVLGLGGVLALGGVPMLADHSYRNTCIERAPRRTKKQCSQNDVTFQSLTNRARFFVTVSTICSRTH